MTIGATTPAIALFGVLGASLTAYLFVTRVLTEPRREQEVAAGFTITFVIFLLGFVLLLWTPPGTFVVYLLGTCIGIIATYYGLLLHNEYGKKDE